jgi:hypothetical protein
MSRAGSMVTVYACVVEVSRERIGERSGQRLCLGKRHPSRMVLTTTNFEEVVSCMERPQSFVLRDRTGDGCANAGKQRGIGLTPCHRDASIRVSGPTRSL